MKITYIRKILLAILIILVIFVANFVFAGSVFKNGYTKIDDGQGGYVEVNSDGETAVYQFTNFHAFIPMDRASSTKDPNVVGSHIIVETVVNGSYTVISDFDDKIQGKLNLGFGKDSVDIEFYLYEDHDDESWVKINGVQYTLKDFSKNFSINFENFFNLLTKSKSEKLYFELNIPSHNIKVSIKTDDKITGVKKVEYTNQINQTFKRILLTEQRNLTLTYQNYPNCFYKDVLTGKMDDMDTLLFCYTLNGQTNIKIDESFYEENHIKNIMTVDFSGQITVNKKDTFNTEFHLYAERYYTHDGITPDMSKLPVVKGYVKLNNMQINIDTNKFWSLSWNRAFNQNSDQITNEDIYFLVYKMVTEFFPRYYERR